MPTQRKVQVILPTKNLYNQDIAKLKARKKRVAAYARVSTDLEEQEDSYQAQCTYYENYIKSNDEWEFVGVYADEGISGTSTKNRDGFLRMIKDAEAGKIDLILTKSISRFARNTLDTLKYVRQLKEKGIEVIFEKENIATLNPETDMILAIFSSLAQEESRSISENVRWGRKKRMEAGKIIFGGKLYGYRNLGEGKLEIIEEEAKVVRFIFAQYLLGYTVSEIVQQLAEREIPSPKNLPVWINSTIGEMLSNERYKGDSLGQKTYTKDYLSKKRYRNRGNVEQYYLTDTHPAIIDPDVFDKVQYMRSKYTLRKGVVNHQTPFFGKVYCGDCGGMFGHVISHDKAYQKYDTWVCRNKYNKKVSLHKCQVPNLKEAYLPIGFIVSHNRLIQDREKWKEYYQKKIERNESINHRAEYREKTDTLTEEIVKTRSEIDRFSESSDDPYLMELIDKEAKLNEQLETEERKYQEAASKRVDDNTMLEFFTNCTKPMEQLDETVLRKVLEKIVVNADSLTYCFLDNNQITVSLEEIKVYS